MKVRKYIRRNFVIFLENDCSKISGFIFDRSVPIQSARLNFPRDSMKKFAKEYPSNENYICIFELV